MSIVRFGALADLVTQSAPENPEFSVAAEMMISGTGRLRKDASPGSEAGGTGFQSGDVLFGKLRPYLSKSWVADRAGSALGDIHVYRPRVGVDSRFLGYVVLGDRFLSEVNASTYGTKMPRANWDSIKTVTTHAPDPDNQRRIADYLDRETATIDAMIEKQHELVSGLRRRSVALRDDVFENRVGRGERLKWSVQEVDERAGTARSDWDVLSVSIAWGVSRKSDREIHQASSEDTSHYKVVRPGDIVVNRMRAFQGGLGCSSFQGLTSPDYGVLRTRSADIDPRWVAAVMKTDVFVGEMVSRLRGIGTVDGSSVRTPRVSLSDIGEIRVSVPSVEHQHADLDHFDRETAKIDALIAKAERFIELAQERRAALITAAVTGQIEIPTED